MSLLVDVAKEYTRISELGYVPTMIIMDETTMDSLSGEMARILNIAPKKLMGMDLKKSSTVAHGAFRIFADFDSAPEDTLERWLPLQTSLSM